VWSTESDVSAAYRAAGQAWGDVEKVAAVHSPHAPHVLIDGSGDASVLWMDGDKRYLSDRHDDGTWVVDATAPLNQANPGTCPDEYRDPPGFANDAAGNIVLTFSEIACEGYKAWTHYVWRFADGSWGPLRDGGGGARLLLTPDGVARFFSTGPGAIWVQTSTRGGELTPIEKVWQGAKSIGDMSLASNAHGDIVLAAVAHDEYGGNQPGRLVVIARPTAAGWSQPYLTPVSSRLLGTTVALNDDGTAAVAYLRKKTDFRVVAQVGTVADNEWGQPAVLSEAVGRAPEPNIAVTPDGGVAAVWATSSFPEQLRTQAAYQAPGGTWGEAVTVGGNLEVAGTSQLGVAPRVAALPDGAFTAVFPENAVMYTDHVDDTTAPVSRVTAPGKEFVRSARIPVRWRSADALSGVRDTDVRLRSAGRSGKFSSWTVWKRRTEDRSAVYAAEPGRTYCFSARARDSAGNLGVWSVERCATTPIDDRALAGRGWARTKDRSAFLLSLIGTQRWGLRLRLDDVRASSLTLLARTCPGCGTVSVSHGGRDLGVFKLNAERRHNRVVIPIFDSTPSRRGPLVIRVASRGKPVYIDGVIAAP
jgi:hypothetical protein